MANTTVRKTALILSATLVLSAGLAACGGKKEEKAATPAGQTVTAATAVSTDLPRSVNASGNVAAWEEVPVGAETGGLTAVGLFVDEGAYVRQGQPLVQMNDVLLRAQLRQQQAAVQTAEANLARDEAALSRAQQLKERGFLSQASLDTALANQRASTANLASARAALSSTQVQVDQATVRAPVSGMIMSRNVTKGQIIAMGTELFRIVRDGRLELDAQVPETELPIVRAGQSASVVADQGDRAGVPIGGHVRIVTPRVDPQTRLGVARIALNPGSGLRPGMFARAVIDIGAAPALTIPAQAVVFREGKPGAYVIGPNDTVRFTPLTTGDRVGSAVVVTSGLQAGARVVVQGAGFLGDGDHVVISTAPTAPPSSTATVPARR